MRSASLRASEGPRKTTVSRMLLPEIDGAISERSVIERPVLDAGNDDSDNGISGIARSEVDDHDLIESAGFETLLEKFEIFIESREGVRRNLFEFAQML